MAPGFFEEDGALPARVRLAFDAVDQDELDRLEVLTPSRGRPPPTAPGRPAGRAPPSLRDVPGFHTASGRALGVGAGAGVIGFVAIVAFGVRFELTLTLGLVAVATAAMSVIALPALRRWRTMRRARRSFQVEVGPSDLVVRSGKTVLRSWQLRDVREVRVERRRVVIESSQGGSRILPIRFISDGDVEALVARTRTLIEAARASRG